MFLQDGRTAVHLAAQYGNNNVMKILLDHSPNLIEQKDNVSIQFITECTQAIYSESVE